jgi:hypothetical protein
MLTALAENEHAVKKQNDPERRESPSWLFDLVGDIHQPLHTAHEICMPVTEASQPMDYTGFGTV